MDTQILIWAFILALIIAFFVARKFKGGIFHKILGGIAITLALGAIFYYLTVAIILFVGFFSHGV